MITGGMRYKPKDEEALITFLHSPEIKHNLLNFVMAVYPWGQPGTPLENYTGPRQWQKQELLAITAHLKENQERIARGETPVMWQAATASGRGPGKSALVSWITDWMMSTNLGSTTIITANTETQLKTRTFAEIGKWTSLLINRHWFECTVLSVKPAPWFAKALTDQLKIDASYYYAQGQLWSEEAPDSFAGVHNPLGVCLQFDEASGVPTPIFNVSAGFFTEPVLHRYWFVYSNPRRNSGGFFDCFHAPDSPWILKHLDARTVEGLDQAVFDKMIQQHGIDSDVVRMEVLGEFPKQGNRQFIGNELVRQAQQRELIKDPGAALILGVDIARYGDDDTVFRFRQGRDARSIPPIRYRGKDNMFIANELAKVIDRYAPDAVNVDGGNGQGVIDRVKELGYRVREVLFGSSSSSPEWANKRTEMYADLRDWLGGGCIDADARLFADLTAAEYHPHGKDSDKTMLQSKEKLRELGYRSPDDSDALVLTFATNVARRDLKAGQYATRSRQARDVDYPVFG